MEIIFLGTSSGTPSKTRNVSACAIKRHNSKSWYLIDCGEGTQHQILRTSLSLKNLSAIFITHMHGDHSYGLPGLLASAALAGRTEPLTLMGPIELKAFIEQAALNSDLKLPYDIAYIDVEKQNKHESKEFDITSLPLSHRVNSYAYAFDEKGIKAKLDKEKLKQYKVSPGPLWGQLQSGQAITNNNGVVIKPEDALLPMRQARRVIIGGDNAQPQLLEEAINTANILVHEATYTQDIADKVGPGPMHSSAKIVAEFAQEAKLDNLILTHFSARYQDNETLSPSIADIRTEAQTYYKGSLFLAKDFEVYSLGIDGQLSCTISN